MKTIYYFRQPDNKKEEYFMYVNNTLLEKSNEVLYEVFNDYQSTIIALKAYNNVK